MMRQNNNRNMYGNQQGGHNQVPGGPLMTNHLRDLDIELELLKRKRDIIQQEQEILNRERFATQRQYDYKQPSNMYNRQEPSQQYSNYSLTYGTTSNSGSYRPQGVKRPSRSDDWQASKRFNSPKVNPWGSNASEQRYESRNTFQASQAPKPRYQPPAPARAPRPLMGKTGFRPPNPAPRSTFQPAKVTKPRPQQPPNKLATYPAEKAKELITKTIGKKKEPLHSDYVLTADTPPASVKGRLELSLGAIFKEIKMDRRDNPDDMEMFTKIQKVLKEILRARIRNVMLGHEVGPVVEIVSRYRKKYPPKSDKELIALARETNLKYQELPWQLLESGDLEVFFKQNMTKLVNHKLEDMFNKITTMYNKKDSGLEKLIASLPDLKETSENKETANGDNIEEKTEEKSDEKDDKNIESALKTKLFNADDGLEVINEKMDKVASYVKLIDGLLEDCLPKILPKFKDLLMSTVFSDKDYQNTKTMIYSSFKSKYLQRLAKEHKKVQTPQKPNEIINLADDVAEQAKDVIIVEDEITPGKENETTAVSGNKTTDVTNTTSVVAKTTDVTNTTSVEAKTTDVTNTTSVEAKSTDVSNAAKTTDVTNNTAKVTANKTADTPQQTPTKAAVTSQPQTPKTPINKDILYIKLIGRPVLPARAVIYEFLNKFNPASIKKHKSLSNLLVIGFKNREDFDKILAANESVVGESTLIIKSSETVNKPTPASTPVKTPEKPQNTCSENIIPSDLDTQITDLLSAIRSSEEVNKEANETEGKDEVTPEAPKASDENTDNNTGTTENNDNENTNDKQVENNNSETTDEAKPKESDENMDTADKKLEAIAENDENGEKCNGKNKVKDSTPATPTRASSRLANATPGTIRTRRASRLAQ